ncbi:MAG: hypothetical protein ACYSWU_08125, partial [Planctomycetota bacterium]
QTLELSVRRLVRRGFRRRFRRKLLRSRLLGTRRGPTGRGCSSRLTAGKRQRPGQQEHAYQQPLHWSDSISNPP